MEERSADPILQRRQHGQGATNAKRQMIKVTVQPGGHQIKLRIWSSTLEVKQQMGARLQGHVSWMRLLHNNVELLNSQLLIDLVPNVKPPRGRGSRDSSGGQGSPSRSLTFWLKVQNPHDFDSGSYLHTWGIGTNAAGAAGEQLLTRAQQGLQIGLAPQLSLEGSGGTYLLRDTQKRPVAAFKPRDEEPFAPNNPRGLAGKMGQPGIHPHVASGDAHIREVLAFRLDWGGFASVPCTLQVEGRHPALHVNSVLPLSRYGAKVGSLQAWVKHDDTASDRGTATFPVHEVHKIAILDMRLLNSDRHDSNLLVVDREKSDGSGTTCELVPIDHGGCLPSLPEVNWFNWCWLSWPQMKVPLSASDAAYVANLDVKAEEKLLTELGVPARPRRALYCSTMLLQRGVAAGLSLLEVASLMCRGDEDEVPSELERLWTQAERLAYSALHNHRLRGCSDSFSSAPASRGATPLGGGARASSPSAAPGAATATTVAAATAEEDDLSAVALRAPVLDERWMALLGDCVSAIGHTVLLLEPWNDPQPLKRAYCIKEVYHTQVSGATFDMVMSTAQQQAFERALVSRDGSFRSIERGLSRVDVRQADCRNAKDKADILDELEKGVGFDKCNTLVVGLLREALVAQGRAALGRLPAAERRGSQLLSSMASLLRNMGKLEEARPLFEEALQGQRQMFGNRDRGTLWSIYFLADLLEKQGKLVEAIPLYTEVLEGWVLLDGMEDGVTREWAKELVSNLRKLGQREEAEALADKHGLAGN